MTVCSRYNMILGASTRKTQNAARRNAVQNAICGKAVSHPIAIANAFMGLVKTHSCFHIGYMGSVGGMKLLVSYHIWCSIVKQIRRNKLLGPCYFYRCMLGKEINALASISSTCDHLFWAPSNIRFASQELTGCFSNPLAKRESLPLGEAAVAGCQFRGASPRNHPDRPGCIFLEASIRIGTLWWTNIAMENHHF